MNLLIVDDNVPMVRGLKKSVDWEKLSVRHVYEAFSIAQARKILEEETIDLLLCDIEMPSGSGLDLLEWVNEQKICCVSVILSSFADFQMCIRDSSSTVRIPE